MDRIDFGRALSERIWFSPRSKAFFLAGALCLSAGHHLRLTRGPAGNRTTTGSLSVGTTPYQLSHEDTFFTPFQSNLDWQGLDLQWPGPSRILSSPNVNDRTRAPSSPLQQSGPFGSSSGPFGSSFRLVGSYTPFWVLQRYYNRGGVWEAP